MKRRSLLKSHWRFASLATSLVLLLAAADCAAAQSAAEYASTVAKTSSIKPPATSPTIVFPQSASAKQKSAHLTAREDRETLELTNRKLLEEQAGKEAGKLLIRSVPSEADVWIEELEVGKTPLLLTLHPGTYVVKVRALGTSVAEQRVGILAKKSHEVVVQLRVRYPAQIRLR